MRDKRKTFAGRLTRKVLVWLFLVVIGVSYFIFKFAGMATNEFYAESFHNNMLITREYTRRVISDVYVAVTNNIFYLEQNLNDPDSHRKVMERIVKNGTRVRSCGISFIKDYYYPQKGHLFCPFAWRNSSDQDSIKSENMGDDAFNYLVSEWFNDIIENDSAKWSDPFYDGYDAKTALAAYMVPIHDQEGKVVAVLGADISLDWLTNKLIEMDSTTIRKASFSSFDMGITSHSYIISHDGTFITHPDEERILEDNFFRHINQEGVSDEERLINKMKSKGISDNESSEKYIYDGSECYVFYTPVKYTDWKIVTVVPCRSIDLLAITNGAVLLSFIVLAMLIIVIVCRYYLKRESELMQALVVSANDLAKGKFNSPLPDVNHNDEIRQLRDSLDNLQFSLSNYVNDMKKKAAEDKK